MPSYNEQFANEVLALTNQFRDQNSLPPLTLNAELIGSAQSHAKDMAKNDYFAHVSPDGKSTLKKRLDATGYAANYYGENIAAGYTSPEDVVNGWIASDGHRANLLNPNFQELGVGYFYLENDTGSTNYGTYWVQVFGSGDTNPETYLPDQPSNDSDEGKGTDGDDILYGDKGRNVLEGYGGNDELWGGSGKDRLLGHEGDDHLYGEDGKDVLDGGQGADILEGGNGNDKYILRNAQQVIVEAADAGIDKVKVQFDGYVLPENVEKLKLANQPEILSATGNVNSNVLVGNDNQNILTGAAGNDKLKGKKGNDTLIGTDELSLGVGEVDILAGGKGADTFVLGNGNNGYYEAQGASDYALLKGFVPGKDLILLHGQATDYRLEALSLERKKTGVGIFIEATDELVGLLKDVDIASVSLTDSGQFQYLAG